MLSAEVTPQAVAASMGCYLLTGFPVSCLPFLIPYLPQFTFWDIHPYIGENTCMYRVYDSLLITTLLILKQSSGIVIISGLANIQIHVMGQISSEKCAAVLP